MLGCSAAAKQELMLTREARKPRCCVPEPPPPPTHTHTQVRTLKLKRTRLEKEAWELPWALADVMREAARREERAAPEGWGAGGREDCVCSVCVGGCGRCDGVCMRCARWRGERSVQGTGTCRLYNIYVCVWEGRGEPGRMRCLVCSVYVGCGMPYLARTMGGGACGTEQGRGAVR